MQQVDEQEVLVSALVKGCIAELVQRGFDITRIDYAPEHVAHVEKGSWRRTAQLIDCAETAEQAYFSVCQQINIDDSICRVLLDDVAEWLVLPPRVYRSIRKLTQLENKRQIAA